MAKKYNLLQLELNRSGVRELLQSSAMQDACAEVASQIQSRCGEGYSSDVYIGRNRCNAMVWADTYQAQKDNAANNTLLKSVSSKYLNITSK